MTVNCLYRYGSIVQAIHNSHSSTAYCSNLRPQLAGKADQIGKQVGCLQDEVQHDKQIYARTHTHTRTLQRAPRYRPAGYAEPAHGSRGGALGRLRS